MLIVILLQREPGPHDPPGPKYESYDSGPSFGNFGPLPPDDHVQPAYMSASLAHGSWNVRPLSCLKFSEMNMMIDVITALSQPSWSQKPAAQSAWNGNGANIMTPGNAAGVPLPASEYAKSPKLSAIGTDMGGSRPLQFQKPPSERDEPTVSKYLSLFITHMRNYLLSSLPSPIAQLPKTETRTETRARVQPTGRGHPVPK